ncbi:transposase [Streptomyces agglomeratus]|uniref:transposase n=1 Tax=Streptomyces agglomeratus TaxID=285458 RepID=UPI000B268661
MLDTEGVGVFLGMDVGKTAHHGHGLTPAGKKVFDKPMPNSEPKLRAVFDKLKAKFGTVLVIVDQPASIGALPLTVARDAGYPDELRERAVREVRSSGRPVAHVARDLGIHKEALRGWVRQAEVDDGGRPDLATSAEKAELAQLRKENAELRRVNEILKAASVFFAKELDQPRTRPTR